MSGKVQVGINHRDFRPGGTNGTSNRKNAVRKRAQYLKNQKMRADVNRNSSQKTSGYTWNSPGTFHSMLDALSNGTA